MKAVSHNYKKIALLLICFLAACQFKAQFIKVASNTTVSLIDLSVIKKGAKNDILIGGDQYYLVGSTDSCNSLTPLSAGPMGSQQRICRIDSSHIFQLTYSDWQSNFYMSRNGGISFWFRSFYFRTTLELVMVDTTVGYYINGGSGLFKTTNGGIAFNNVPMPDGISYVTVQKLFTPTPMDTILVFAGMKGAFDSFLISSDKGATWSASKFGTFDLNTYDGWLTGADCLGRDTFIAITGRGDVFLTVNKGLNWQKKTTTLVNGSGIYATSPGHIYALGSDAYNKAMVSVSNDLGDTWQSFVSPYSGKLLNMAMLGDSVAILTGTDGLILKWYMREALLTGITSLEKQTVRYTLYPNPVSTTLNIRQESPTSDLSYRLYNTLGETLDAGLVNNQAVDVRNLPPGLYFIQVSVAGTAIRLLKFVKD